MSQNNTFEQLPDLRLTPDDLLKRMEEDQAETKAAREKPFNPKRAACPDIKC
jgi:hypothetical protein